MEQSTPISNMATLLAEKQRLQTAIYHQEQVIQKQFAKSKADTVQQLAPTNLLKNGISHIFSIATLRNNPISYFQIGYKIIAYMIRKRRKR